MTNKIGQDFKSSVIMNLLPMIEVPQGYYQTTLTYLTETGGITTFHNCTFNSGHNGFLVEVGRDVYEITISTHSLSGLYGSRTQFYYHQTLRVDWLILLNMLNKLLKKG